MTSCSYHCIALMIAVAGLVTYVVYVESDLICRYIGYGMFIASEYLNPVCDISKVANYLNASNNINSTNLNSKRYITSAWKLNHGLGNYMFQYASLLGLASILNMEPVIMLNSNRTPLEDVFELQIRKTNQSIDWIDVWENCVSCYKPQKYIDKSCKSIQLNGFLVSSRYFSGIRDTIVSHFTFKPNILRKAKLRLAKILKDFCSNATVTNCLLIGVHIRRGDFLNEDQIKYGYLVANERYIQQAVEYYSHKYANFTRVFVVLGNDFKWNNNTFKTFITDTHTVLKPTTTEADLCILSLCNHTIMTVGTFGFWAGYLAGGDVVYLRNFTRNDSPFAQTMRESPYPSNWIGL